MTPDEGDGRRDPVTVRQAEVLDALADGLTTAAIGRRLGISEGTVRRHLERLRENLGVHDRVALAVWWVRRRDR